MPGDVASIVIVGASLSGLRAAEALRNNGYRRKLLIVGEEAHPPYDRPPLSKQVLFGLAKPDRTALPSIGGLDAEWRLGIAATGLDLLERRVTLGDGQSVGFDRLLIATGTRARAWQVPAEAGLAGVMTLRTSEDAAALKAALDAKPRRVVVIGGGFTGCEIASACRELDIPVTLIERSATPLSGALGCVVGRVAASLQRAHGVDLRCDSSVARLEGDAAGHVRRVHLEGIEEPVEADLVVVALGSIPNVEWLAGSGLAISSRGVACDPGCRAYDRNGIAVETVYVSGDAARFPHPLFNFEFMTLEHWGNAVSQANVAAENMINPHGARRPHIGVPAFWSSQFGISMKSVGVPAAADHLAFIQGSPDQGRFLAVYGKQGRLVAAVGFDHGKWLQHYEALIESGADFPGVAGMDASKDMTVMEPEFPHPSRGGLNAYITLSGHLPSDRETTLHLAGKPSQSTGSVTSDNPSGHPSSNGPVGPASTSLERTS